MQHVAQYCLETFDFEIFKIKLNNNLITSAILDNVNSFIFCFTSLLGTRRHKLIKIKLIKIKTLHPAHQLLGCNFRISLSSPRYSSCLELHSGDIRWGGKSSARVLVYRSSLRPRMSRVRSWRHSTVVLSLCRFEALFSFFFFVVPLCSNTLWVLSLDICVNVSGWLSWKVYIPRITQRSSVSPCSWCVIFLHTHMPLLCYVPCLLAHHCNFPVECPLALVSDICKFSKAQSTRHLSPLLLLASVRLALSALLIFFSTFCIVYLLLFLYRNLVWGRWSCKNALKGCSC